LIISVLLADTVMYYVSCF